MSKSYDRSASSTACLSILAPGQEWVRKPGTACNPHSASRRKVAASEGERARVIQIVDGWVYYRRAATDDGPQTTTHRLELRNFRRDFQPADSPAPGSPLPRSVRRSMLRALLSQRRGYPATQRTASPGGG